MHVDRIRQKSRSVGSEPCYAERRLFWSTATRDIPPALTGLAALYGQSGAAAAQRHQLRCQGQSVQGGVVIASVRSLEAHNAMGDGFARFGSRVQTDRIAGRHRYEGYTNVGAFDGLITGSGFAPIAVAVLDNAGGGMIVYAGGAQLGAPEVLAREVKTEAARRNINLKKLFEELWDLYKKANKGTQPHGNYLDKPHKWKQDVARSVGGTIRLTKRHLLWCRVSSRASG